MLKIRLKYSSCCILLRYIEKQNYIRDINWTQKFWPWFRPDKIRSYISYQSPRYQSAVWKTKEYKKGERFKKLVEEKLANAHVIREFKGSSHCWLLALLSYDENEWDELGNLVKTTNSCIFRSQLECSILKFWPTKKEKKTPSGPFTNWKKFLR